MKVQFGADVITYDEKKVGTVKEVVLDPATKEITHLIIEKGLVFTEDKVLPISLVLDAREDEVKLVETDQDLHELPDFEEDQYFPVASRPMYDPDLVYSRNFLIAKPRIAPKQQEGVRVTEVKGALKNIPDDAERLQVGADVVTLDGEKVGLIKEILLESPTDQVSHVVLDRGLLKSEDALIPIHWVDQVSEDEVKLLVDQEVIQNLPPHLEQEG